MTAACQHNDGGFFVMTYPQTQQRWGFAGSPVITSSLRGARVCPRARARAEKIYFARGLVLLRACARITRIRGGWSSGDVVTWVAVSCWNVLGFGCVSGIGEPELWRAHARRRLRARAHQHGAMVAGKPELGRSEPLSARERADHRRGGCEVGGVGEMLRAEGSWRRGGQAVCMGGRPIDLVVRRFSFYIGIAMPDFGEIFTTDDGPGAGLVGLAHPRGPGRTGRAGVHALAAAGGEDDHAGAGPAAGCR